MLWFRNKRDDEMRGAFEQRLRKIEERLHLVRDQVDNMQITAAESKRPWFRNASNVLSVTALVVSIAFGLMTIRQKIIDDRIAKRAQIRELISRLMDIEQEYRRDALNQDEALLGDLESTINKKRGVYLQDIERLERELSEPLTFREYTVLADNAIEASEVQLAAEYFRRAEQQASTNEERIAAALFQAAVFFTKHIAQDVDKGRALANKALSLAQQQDDPASRCYFSSMALAKWAEFEHNNKQYDVAYSKLDLSIDWAQRIEVRHRLRSIAVDRLVETVADWTDRGEDFAGAPVLRAKLLILRAEQHSPTPKQQ